MPTKTQHLRPKTENKPKLVFIVGPTSSGKTAVSLELTKILPSEIISCDSAEEENYMINLDKLDGNPEALDAGEVTCSEQVDVIKNDINKLNNKNKSSEYKTDYYKRFTEKLLIPMPELSDEKLYYKFNFDDEYGDRHLLTTTGFHQIIDSIRNEEKRRREIVVFWFTITMGLIGAFTGLISIIKN